MNKDAEYRVKRPVLASIKRGKKYFAHVKVGGESQLLNVMASSDPYKDDYGKGRKAFYVDVFGYDYKGSLLASKLREVEVVKEMEATC